MTWKEILNDKRYLGLALGFVVIIVLAVILVVAGDTGKGTPTVKATATPTQDLLTMKTDSVLLDLVQAYRIGGVDEAQRFARDRGIITKNDTVRLTLVLDTSDSASTVTKLQELGAKVEATNENLITASAPLSLVLEKSKDINNPGFFDGLAGLEHVVDIRIPTKPETEEIEPLSEGVNDTGAADWHAAGFTGKGIKVGIIDGGFDGYEQFLGQGLPQSVTVKSFTQDGEIAPEGAEHGTAVAEIVHEMAPDAQLFLTNFDSDADWLNAVDWLVSQGVKVISQSMGDMSSPLDGTGVKAKKIESVKAKGILWVNSNGNYGDNHWGGGFKPDGNGWHEFSPGKSRMRVKPTPSGYFNITLNWQDWGSKNVDYDLYLYNSKDEVAASSRNAQAGSKDPVERIFFPAVKGEEYAIAIKAKDPSKKLVFDVFTPNGAMEFPVARGSMNAYAASKGAFAVGAIHWQSGILEPYSSQGPTWDGRMKPDISAPASVSSLIYGDSGFAGTSAAAPHVAGAAALVFGANPSYTPDQVGQYLQGNAIDLGSIGVSVKDSRFGYGLLYLGKVPGGR